MSFPDLVPFLDPAKGPGGIQDMFAEATGIPDNGSNTFAMPFIGLGVNPTEVDINKMKIWLLPLASAPGVLGGNFVSLSPDKTQMTFSFIQTGVGEARLVVQVQHSVTR